MVQYTVKRVFNAIMVFLVSATIAFIVFNTAPGDYVTGMMGMEGTERQMLEAKTNYGLNEAAPVRYYKWVRALTKGDLGVSYYFYRPVTQVIKSYLPFTLSISIISFVIALIISLLLSIAMALKRNSIIDYILSTLSIVGISVPEFWIPCVIFAVYRTKINFLPYIGQAKQLKAYAFQDYAMAAFLPIIFLTFIYIGSSVRYFRSAIQEIWSQEYIRSARSRGVSEGKIIFKHTLKNSLIPVITFTSLTIPSLISTTIVIEAVLKCPGLGRIFLDSCFTRDVPLLMGITVLTIALIILFSFIADICYMLVDPRIRFD